MSFVIVDPVTAEAKTLMDVNTAERVHSGSWREWVSDINKGGVWSGG